MPLRTIGVLLSGLLGALANTGAHAHGCSDSDQADALHALERSAGGYTPAQRGRAAAIVAGLCGGQGEAVVDSEPSTGGESTDVDAVADAGSEGDSERVRIFGMEVRKGDSDSAGNERLRRKR